MLEALKKEILAVDSKKFDELALKIFRFQAKNCKPYSLYLKNLDVAVNEVNSIEKIPFLPISFFKTQLLLSNNLRPETIFESSGTTGKNTSRHYISDTDFYKKIAEKIFIKCYGNLDNYHIIAMLPSYLERGNSSLIFMVKHFIEQTNSPFSAFYSADYEAIINVLKEIVENSPQKKILLWGVTFAMLEMAEMNFDFSFLKDKLIVLETGGMKGRKKEIVREQLYEKLKSGFGVSQIHSEYGMTELLSQAYSYNDALFYSPSTMKILIRETTDPFQIYDQKVIKTGGINIIDLANVESCSFIETQDLGQYGAENGSFKVLGRFDNSDLRGCNLLID